MDGFLKAVKERVLVFDGSKGAVLATMGLKGGECSESWNITHPDRVKQLYEMYRDAGADVLQTNSFPGNRIHLEKYRLGDRVYEINYSAARLAKEVMGDRGYVAASIGPTGELMEPVGELSFDDAYRVFCEQVKAAADAGVDAINFETFTDIGEMRAAILAARDTCKLPLICNMAFERNGRTLMGSDPYTCGIIMKSLGADIIGANCSLGPGMLVPVIREMAEVGGIPLCVKPNAGIPEMIEGKAVFKETPEKFAETAPEFVKAGVKLIGGCCGTTPQHVSVIKTVLEGSVPAEPDSRGKQGSGPNQVIASSSRYLKLDGSSVKALKIDLTADKELKSQLESGNPDGFAEVLIQSAQFDVIYLNITGMSRHLKAGDIVNAIQSYAKAPLIIEAEDAGMLEKVLRIYRGKAGVVIGSAGSGNVHELLAAARKYGSTIVSRDIVA